jgi:hypothetical protein
LSSSHLSRPGSVSGLIASTGHSGTQTPQSMHSSGWMTSMFSPAQLALAWVLGQGDDIVPIPGTKRRRYLEENVGALDVRLTPEELTEIDSLLPPGAAAGPRYT